MSKSLREKTDDLQRFDFSPHQLDMIPTNQGDYFSRLDVISLAEKHEIESRAEVARLKACPSHRSNLPVEVVGCSECIACLQLNLKWTNERLRTMQHGETEALKMMGAEKRRADEMTAQLETERAEFAEFRRRLLKALKPVGIESGLLDIELAAVRTQELAAARGDAAETKQELAAMRDLAETLAKGISAYRWKSESVAAAWENDYGHTVPR